MCPFTSDENVKKECVATAASIIGAKWTPQILYALYFDICRFCELQKEVGGVNPRTLSARLNELDEAGIVQKISYAELPPRVEYVLTEKGRDLVPILEDMVAWGRKYHPEGHCQAAEVSDGAAQAQG